MVFAPLSFQFLFLGFRKVGTGFRKIGTFYFLVGRRSQWTTDPPLLFRRPVIGYHSFTRIREFDEVLFDEIVGNDCVTARAMPHLMPGSAASMC